MPNFIGKLKFNCRDFGIAEVYPMETDDHNSAVVKMEGLAALRLAMICDDTRIVDATVSDTDIRGDSKVVSSILQDAGTYSDETVPKTYQSDDGLLIRETSAAFIHRGLRCCRLVPSDEFDAFGNLDLQAGFITAMDAFRAVLVANFAIAAKIPGALEPPFYNFFPIDTAVFERHGTRKAGRPFGLPVGRRVIR